MPEKDRKFIDQNPGNLEKSLLSLGIILSEDYKKKCPKGGKHNVVIDQLGIGPDRSYNDPMYYVCNKCALAYWPKDC